MITIELDFEGIGLFTKKEIKPGDKKKVWKVLFPIDQNDCHKLIFSAKGSNGVYLSHPISLAVPNTILSFKTTDATSSISSLRGFSTLFDVTGSGAHENGLDRNPYWYNHCVLLEIPDAILNVVEMTKSKYILKSQNRQNIPLNHIGYSVTGRIELKNTGKLILSDNSGTVFFDSSKHKESNFRLKFDNNCDIPPSRGPSDLGMLYRIIQDKNDPLKQFSVDRNQPGCFLSLLILG